MRPLTPAETTILRRLVAVEGQKVVATQLGISPATVRVHLQHVYAKLGVTTLIGAYRELGWLAAPAHDL